MRVPALGLACIAAAVANAGHTGRLLDLVSAENPESEVRRVIREFQPEAIGLSVRNIDDQRMRNPRFLLDQAREAVAWCRASSTAPIILGGAGFSILPQPILEYLGADMGIQGEGEEVFPELIGRLDRGADIEDMPGVFRADGRTPAPRIFRENLDALPLPEPHLLAQALSGAEDAPVPVQSRRGCPLACSYCSTPMIEGCGVRRRSPEAVVQWMARWVAEGFRRFYFVDNTFNLPPAYAAQVCSEIIHAGLDISWRCILFPGGLTPELIARMAEAGCAEVSLGFESGCASMLRRMHKSYGLDVVRRASEHLRRQHIRRMGFLLLGGPGETTQSVLESFAFAESLELDALNISVGIRIYPHTGVARTAMQEGIIVSERDLLLPKFYIARGLEDWLYETAARYAASNPSWIL